MPRTERNSSIELLRIILMLFIIAHHLLVHNHNLWADATMTDLPLLIIDSALFVSVNVFVLISGYYTIKFSLKKMLRIYLLCCVVGGIFYFQHLFVDGSNLGRSVLLNTVFSISNGAWFIRVYLYLFLLSPLINTALLSSDERQLRLVLIAETVICLYFGWLWQDPVDKDGYGFMNFVWLYTLGFYLRKLIETNKFKQGWCRDKKYLFLLIWIVSSVINGVLYLYLPNYGAWVYNNPLIVLSAVSFFLFFSQMNFHCKWINILATSTLGVYLIHENNYFRPYIYDSNLSSWYLSNPVRFILAVLGIYLFCVIVDVCARRFINMIMNGISKRWSNNGL